jgi:hypothetical protein
MKITQSYNHSRVCKNCLELLTADRRTAGICVRCEKIIKVSQQEKLSSTQDTTLHATLKRDLDELSKKESEKKSLEQKQQNKTDFFDNLKKIKKSS